MKIVMILFSLLFSVSLLYGDQWQEKQKNLINNLYKNRIYHGAIGEIRTLMHYNPIYQKDGLYDLALCYYKGKQFNRVIYTLKGAFAHGFRNDLLAGHSFIALNDYSTALLSLRTYNYSILKSDGEKSDLLHLRLKTLLLQGNFIKAQKELTSALDYMAHSSSYTLLQRELKTISENSLPIGGVAALLSAFLPGLGHFYCGRIIDGFISLIAVAGAVTGAVLTFNSYRDVSAVLITMSVVFYGTSIYSAYNSASSLRKTTIKRAVKELQKAFKEDYKPETYSRLIK